MTHDPIITDPSANTRCQKHTRNGRCRMLVADPSSTFCPEHSRRAVRFRSDADLSTLLTHGLTEFKSATPINDFLSRLLLLQSEGRIPPRRAAVMAYTCNLLLRTLPAIEHELNPPSPKDLKDQEDHTIIMDIPCAVAQRTLQAQHVQDPERALYERFATHHVSNTEVHGSPRSESGPITTKDPPLQPRDAAASGEQ